MNIICIRIEESLDAGQLREVREALARVPYVTNVEMLATATPELMVEFEEHHNVPVRLLNRLSKQGLHTDIQYC